MKMKVLSLCLVSSFVFGCGKKPDSNDNVQRPINGNSDSSSQEVAFFSDLESVREHNTASAAVIERTFGITNSAGGAAIWLLKDSHYISAYFGGAVDQSTKFVTYNMLAVAGSYTRVGDSIHFEKAQFTTCPNATSKQVTVDGQITEDSISYTMDSKTYSVPEAKTSSANNEGYVINWGCIDSAGKLTEAHPWTRIK